MPSDAAGAAPAPVRPSPVPPGDGRPAPAAAVLPETLGFAADGPEQAIDDRTRCALLGLPGAGRRQTMRLGEQSVAIEQFDQPGRPTRTDGDAASLWFQHLALVVADMAHGLSARARAAAISRGRPAASASRHRAGCSPSSFAIPMAIHWSCCNSRRIPGLRLARQVGDAGQIGLGIDHSAISVADADASAAFYSALGLGTGERTLNAGAGAATSRRPRGRGGGGGADAPRSGHRIWSCWAITCRAATPARPCRQTTWPRHASSGRARRRRCCATLTATSSRFGVRGATHDQPDPSLLPGRLLRRAGPPKPVAKFQGVQIDDPRLAEILSPKAGLLDLYEGTLHGEGPVWEPARNRLRLVRRAEPPAARLAPGRRGDGRHRRHLFHERQRARGGRQPGALRTRAALHQPLATGTASPSRSSRISRASGSTRPTT